MTFRETWKAAKKTSDEKFAVARQTWLEKIAQQADAGDAGAKKTMLEMALRQMGEDIGSKYTEPMSFKGDLGPTLDTIEKAHAAAKATFAKLTIAQLLKDKKLNAVWRADAKKTYTMENYDFLNSGYKLSPDKLYALYIDDSGKQQINIPSKLRDPWDKAAAAKDWKAAKKLIPATVKEITALTERDALRRMVSTAAVSKELYAAIAGPKLVPLIEKARSTAGDYGRQVAAYETRWKAHGPDFWTPMLKALDTILGELTEIRKHYP